MGAIYSVWCFPTSSFCFRVLDLSQGKELISFCIAAVSVDVLLSADLVFLVAVISPTNLVDYLEKLVPSLSLSLLIWCSNTVFLMDNLMN